MIFYVHVAVALTRPPTEMEIRRYAVEAVDENEAELIAAQMASCTSVMPIWSGAVGDEYCLTPRMEWRFRTWGMDTRDCECNHKGMGLAWHDHDCPSYRRLKRVLA